MYFLENDTLPTGASKGNQEKWYDEELDRWYKLDQFGYEALSETIVSIILQQSNIESDTPFRFVTYHMEHIRRNGIVNVGCYSKNFITPGKAIVTIGDLLHKTLTKQERKSLAELDSLPQKIEELVKIIVEITKLDYFPQYLTLLFEIDSLVLNDDRHFNNIAVIEDSSGFSYCPIFDNGASLLSNLVIGSLAMRPIDLQSFLRAMPFGIGFTEQVLAAHQLFGTQLAIHKFSKDELHDIVYPLTNYYRAPYRSAITDRIITTISSRQSV